MTVDYNPEPHTQGEYLSSLWRKVGRIESEVQCLSDRVTTVERAMWAVGGGLAVVSVLLVPQFLRLL